MIDYSKPSKNRGKNSTMAGMSACLLIKDENHHLIEWLAYHYHVLPLRHLIIAVDPDSKTSPLTVLQRWDGTGLKYTIWNDTDFISSYNIEKRAKKRNMVVNSEDESKLSKIVLHHHRERQGLFLMECYRQHKLMNHSWVIHIDTDEFVVFNRIGEDEDEHNVMQNRELRRALPRVGEQTVVEVLEKAPSRFCHSMARLLFTDEERGETDTMVGPFNTKGFDSMRYTYHHYKGNNISGRPKVVVDLLQIPLGNFTEGEQVYSIHRPWRDLCDASGGTDLIEKGYRESILRVNHYIGSWEDYSLSGNNRTRDKFDKKSNSSSAGGGPSLDILPWLGSFIKEVGTERAKFLLQGVGENELMMSYPNSQGHF